MISEGTILAKHMDSSPISGHCNQLFMHVLHTSDRRCNIIKFSIFDYATKELKYSWQTNKVKYLHEFEPNILQEIASASLKQIGYEQAPFQTHVLTLQAKINVYRENFKPE